jgi:flagellar protein FlaG
LGHLLRIRAVRLVLKGLDMSTDSNLPIGSAPAMRPPATSTLKAAGEPAAADASPAVKLVVPEKPELTLDPQQRKRELSDAIERINQQMRSDGRALSFSVDEKADRTVVTVKNSETGKVVRQFPDEALLRVAHHLEDVKGLLQDERI